MNIDPNTVALERFSSVFGAVSQGPLIHELVRKVRRWLASALPQVVHEYPNYPRAICTVLRLAWSDPAVLYPQLIKAQAHPACEIGLAELITNQTVQHPDFEAPFEGTFLKYWLTKDATLEVHRAAAEALVHASGKLALRATALDPNHSNYMIAHNYHYIDLTRNPFDPIEPEDTPGLSAANKAFTVLTQDQLQLMPGLAEILTPIGEPAILSAPPTDYSQEYYDIIGDGLCAQLYYNALC